MITPEYGKTVLACDSCDEKETFDSFQEALDYAKKENWKRIRVEGDWEHHCPECSFSLYA